MMLHRPIDIETKQEVFPVRCFTYLKLPDVRKKENRMSANTFFC